MAVDVVRLRDVERKTWDEIGWLIGRDESTARRRYKKAKRPVRGNSPLAAIRRLVEHAGKDAVCTRHTQAVPQ